MVASVKRVAQKANGEAIVRYGYASIPFEWRKLESWPTVTVSHIPTLDLPRFERFSRAIRAYFETNGSLKAALSEANCTKDAFYDQLKRCLQPADATGSIVGWAGLLWMNRLSPYNRQSDSGGFAGRFSRWLQANPDWEDLLVKMIKKGGGGDKTPGKAPAVRSVAAQFIEKIKTKLPSEQYPRTSKSTARRSIERYIANYVAMDLSTTTVWRGKAIAARQHLGTGHEKFLLAAAPFDLVGCDAHTVDAVGVLILDGPAGPQRIPIDRMKIVAIICYKSRVCTGFSICIRPQVSAAHVEEAYLNGTQKWIPLKLTIKGLKYDTGAGFPCGAVEGLEEVNFAALQLDNAAQHFARGVQQRLHRSIGCMVGWGAVGHWWRNAVIERFFGALSAYGFKRLPSTMGFGPGDPQRGDPLLEAAGRGIEWHELIQLLDVLLANYNARPSRALGGRSPLDVVRTTLSGSGAAWVPRVRPPYTAYSARPGIEVLTKRINGYAASRVPPYVELDEVRYSSPELSKRYDWIRTGVIVHVPKRDARIVEAFLDTGERIGELRCMDSGWAMTAHSLEQRKAINALIRDGQLYVPDGGDPVACFINHLSTKAYASSRSRSSLEVSADATTVAETLRMSGASAPAPAKPASSNPATSTVARKPPLGVALPKRWK